MKLKWINDDYLVDIETTNCYYKEHTNVVQWLSKGNTPEPELTDDELNKQRILSIKSKAGEIISSKYSIVWQLNHPRGNEAYKLDYEWIDSIRAISNKAEKDGTALDDVDWGI